MKSHCEFFSCDICQYKFKSQSILEEHMNTHVEDPVNTVEKKGKEKTSVKTLTKVNFYFILFIQKILYFPRKKNLSNLFFKKKNASGFFLLFDI